MKRRWMFSLSLGLFLLLIILACASEIKPTQVRAEPTTTPATTLLFLGNKNIAPVVYLDGITPSGVAIDLVRALAKHIPQPMEIKVMGWSEAQSLVARGEADALIQINPTEERRKIYDFSDTLLESHFSIFTSQSRIGISGLSSLRGLRVGVESGGLPQQLLLKDPQIQITIIPNFLEGFTQLNKGTIDAVVVDYRVGSYVLANNNIRNIKVTGEPIASSYSAFAVKKGNTKLLNEINNALQIIKTDGTYAKILNNWKPTEGVFETQEQITQRNYYAAIIILLTLLLIAVIWMVTIKKELIKRNAAEEKLREQNSTLQGIINSANALIFSVDSEYRYTSFNNAHASVMQKIYGAKIQPGNSMLDYMTVAEDREKAKQNLDRALAGEQIVEEAYSGDELRSRQYFQVSHSPIKIEEEIIGIAVLAQDMTERKQMEETLRESEQRYRDIFDNVLDSIFLLEVTTDGRFRIIEVNPALERACGIPRSQSIGKTQEEIVQGETANRVNAQYRRCVEAGQPTEEEVELDVPSGRRIFHTTTIPVHDATGLVNRIIGIARDITEYKKTKEVLRESEDRYREIFENSADVLYLLEVTEDGHFRNLEVNRAFEKSTGLSRTQLLGKIIEETVSDETSRIVNALYHRCADTGEIIDEDVEFLLPMGKRVYHSTLVPLRDDSGRIYRILGISHDITKSKQAEEEIQKTNTLLAETQAITHLGGWDYERATGQCTWTDEVYHIYGVGRDYDPSDISSVIKFYAPKDAPVIEQAFRQAIEQGKPYDLELEFIRADGVPLWVRTMGKPIMEDGRVVRVTGNIMDITEHKQAVQALLVSEQKYYEEKQKRSQELEILAQVSFALRQAINQQEIATVLLNETINALQADVGVVFLFSTNKTSPEKYLQGSDAEELLHLFTPGNYFWDQIQNESIYTFNTNLVENANERPGNNSNNSSTGSKSVVCFQLKAANDLIGFLVLGFSNPHKLSNSEQRLLESIAEMGGNALHRSGVMEMLEKRVADRTLELKTLYDISVIATQPLDLKVIIENVLQKTIEAVSAQVATIYRIDTVQDNLTLITHVSIPSITLIQTIPIINSIREYFESENEPQIINSTDSLKLPFLVPESEYHSCMQIPIQIESKIYGTMFVIWEQIQEITVENVALLSSVAKRLGVAIQNNALHKRSEEAAVLEERHRLASELHDSVTQLLYGQTLLTNAGQEYLKNNDFLHLGQCLDDLGSIALQSLKEMRLMLYELHSSPASQEGLEIALRHRLENVEKRAGIKTKLIIEGTIQLSINDQNELFLISCEALNNSLKHSNASSINILLQSQENHTTLEISDNGIGFDTTVIPETGMGLQNMKDRAKRLRSELAIISGPNIGTCVCINFQ